jgi:hypothetical protein
MRNNLTKKTVRQAPTLELAMRFNRLLQTAETMPAHVLTMADAREVLWIEDELHRRLLVAIGHDFYPPEVAAKPTMADMKVKKKLALKSVPVYHTTQLSHPCSAGIIKKAEAEIKTEGTLGFKVTIINSLGATAAQFNVRGDSKTCAEIAAQKMIKQLGLKKAKYKIS